MLFKILLVLDDIFLALGILCIVIASYMVNAVLGTYVLGAAFLALAALAAVTLRNSGTEKIRKRSKKE